MNPKMNRRNILRGMLGGGAVTVGMPLLDCFLNTNGTALASGAPLPVRFGTWNWGCGINPQRWVPTKVGAGYDLPVELKAIEPPRSVQDAMEKQMRAEREKRAVILTAEGVKQSQILAAEGERQSAILRAEGAAQAAVLRAQGDARAIEQVFAAIHAGDADPKLLAYQYLQVLPQIANSPSNKLWIIPTELTAALKGIAGAMGGVGAPAQEPGQ